MKHIESAHQRALMQWASLNKHRLKALELLHAIPNGGYALSARSGARLKAEGLKAGVPDLYLPVARGDYHGFYLELKAPGEKPSKLQQSWHDRLRAEGYKVEVFEHWQEAAQAIEGYLEGRLISILEGV